MIIYCVSNIGLIDISDPEDPNSLGTIRVLGPQKLAVTQNYAYAIIENNNREAELGIFNINDPRGGFFPSYFPIANRWSCFAVSGVNVFIAQPGRIDILDITNRSQPELVGSYEHDFTADKMVIEGDFLYLACGRNGIEVIDISDIENPQTAGYYNTPGRALDIEASNGYIYVADYSSFEVYEFTPPNWISKGTDVGTVLPTEFSITSVYPNPFNSTSTISYSLSAQSHTTIGIYNIRGQLVDVLQNGMVPKGRHEVTWDAQATGAGVYLVRMSYGNNSSMRKVILMK